MGALRSEATEGEGSFAMPPEGVHVWDMGRLQLLVDAELIWAHWEQRQQKVRRVACLPLASIAMPLGECACGVWGGCNSWWMVIWVHWALRQQQARSAWHKLASSLHALPSSPYSLEGPSSSTPNCTPGCPSLPPFCPSFLLHPSLHAWLPQSINLPTDFPFNPFLPGTLRMASPRLLPPSFLLHPSLHDWMPLSFSPISLPPSSIPVDFASPFRPPPSSSTPPFTPGCLSLALTPPRASRPIGGRHLARFELGASEVPAGMGLLVVLVLRLSFQGSLAPGEEAHATRAHLENALAACRLLNSPDEFRRLLAEYVRLLTK
ncbi:unnamed protein product [Closterium sp. NIES-64]|nr:unnamed protein product [Closterium sp. NIES-64]